MSFNDNHIISISNYEEWFILYMDDELDPEQKKMVDNFLLLHPALQEELDLLLGTKLPVDNIVFSGKADLQAEAMKLNVVDETLLRYIDNELSPAEAKAVEEKLTADQNFRSQHTLLKATKLDASEVIPYPNKVELYRRSEKVVPLFPIWMRIAVAIVLLLFGSYFFLGNNNDTQVVPATDYAKPAQQKEVVPLQLPAPVITPEPSSSQQQTLTAKVERPKAVIEREKVNVVAKSSTSVPVQPSLPEEKTLRPQVVETAAIAKSDAIQFDVKNVSKQAVSALNNSVTNLAVTSVTPASYNLSEDPEASIVTDGDNNPKTPAKGFLRKVSRFIERRTGIGTVNADNELLIGAVALKLN